MPLRRSRIDLATPIEKQIRDAIWAIEKMPVADVRLTNAQTHLSRALDELGAYVDEQLTEALGDR